MPPRDRLAVDQHVLLGQVPAARPHEQRRGVSFSLYALPSGDVKSIRRRIASRRLSCPCMLLSQRGVLASSKSAMNTLAPELSALMTILRSTGPVISTRRSCDVGGHRRAGPVAFAHGPRLGQEVGQLAGVELRLPRGAAREQLGAAAAECALQVARRTRRASGVRICAYSGVTAAVISMPGP